MATQHKTRALVFKKKDVNDSDRIFSVFADEFGRLDIHAKAIRKCASKLRGGIDIFSLSDIEFIQGRNKKTLTDAVVVKNFGKFLSDPEKFKIAGAIADVLDNFVGGEERDEALFSLLDDTLERLSRLETNRSKLASLYYYFLWNTMSLLGYHPETEKCNACQSKLNPYNIYFSYKSGGVICKKCLGQDTKSQKINSDVLKLIRLILSGRWDVVSRLKIGTPSDRLFRNISDNYYSYTLSSHAPKS